MQLQIMCKLNHVLFCIAALIFFLPASEAKTHKPKDGSAYATVLESFYQRTIPGIRGAPITVNYHFIILWMGTSYPKSFEWKSESGTKPCSMTKAHKAANRTGKFHQQQRDYDIEKIEAGNIHKGDTLMLTVAGNTLPNGVRTIPEPQKNSLLFKTRNGDTFFLPIDTIEKKHDIIMP